MKPKKIERHTIYLGKPNSPARRIIEQLKTQKINTNEFITKAIIHYAELAGTVDHQWKITSRIYDLKKNEEALRQAKLDAASTRTRIFSELRELGVKEPEKLLDRLQEEGEGGLSVEGLREAHYLVSEGFVK